MPSTQTAPRWRFLVSPKWLGWHLLVIVAVLGMLALGDWQLHRAEAGNALSWAYTFEWPIFAGFAIVFWAKTVRDEFRPPAAPRPASDVGLPPGALAPGEGQATGADTGAHGEKGEAGEEEDPDLAAYNAYLARLTKEVKGHGRWHGLR